ncbi:MAG: PadR family transcriptional regulator [Bdellovibrionales bacterium]|nr:PadR family transcriptional regulator [Bdellovibrionales bacterium]
MEGIRSIVSSQKTSKKKQLTLPDLIVLSLLSERSMHGYEIVTELEARDVNDWASISRPQVYYSLKKLHSLKLIREASDSRTALGPDRTTFKINSKGSDGLANGLSELEWAQQRERPPFLTWMALSAHLPKTTIKKLFEARRSYLKSELSRESATLDSFKGKAGAMVIAGKLMVELTVRMFEVELDWLNSAQEKMIQRNEDRLAVLSGSETSKNV